MTKEWEQELIDAVASMTYEQMLRLHRFTPIGGSPYFQTGTRPCAAFWDRWEHLYATTPAAERVAASKRIGWGDRS